jgi:hypothetical protein
MPALVGLDDDLVCDALTFVCRDVRWMSYMIAFSGERNSPGLYSAAVFLLSPQKTIVLGFMHMVLGLEGRRRPGETRRDFGLPKKHCLRLHAYVGGPLTGLTNFLTTF